MSYEPEKMRGLLEKIKNKGCKEPILKLFDNISGQLLEMPASIKYHHNEKGGLFRHTYEVMDIALKLYNMFFEVYRKHAITEDDVIIVSFLHDIEKITKYRKKSNDSRQEFEWNYDRIDSNDTALVVSLAAKYGVLLNDKQLNSLTYAHGGWSVDKGKMKPLAILLHTADLYSVYLYS